MLPHSLLRHFERWANSPAGLAFLEAAFIGCMSGLSAVLLQHGVGWLGGLRVFLSHQWPAWLVLPAIGFIGGSLAGWLVESLAPNTSGSGIPQVKAVLAHASIPMTLRVALVKVVSTVIALGFGLALGRQGATVQIGSALATQLSRIFPSIARTRSQLIAVGAGSGLAAAFNTPLAGMLFVIEALLQDFSSSTLSTAILAAFVGAVVARLLGAPGLGIDLIKTGATTRFFPLEIPFYIVLGILSGLLGAAFNQCIMASLNFNQRTLQQRFRLNLSWRVGLAGLVTGLIVMLLPPLYRDYTGLRVLLTESEGAWSVAAIAFGMLFVLASIAYGSGAPGGLFAPSLILGASLGQLVGIGAQVLVGIESPLPYALVGMGAFLSATIRVPITAIVLIFEMTANFNLVLPLMIGVVIAYLVGETVSPGSLDDRLLAQSGIHLDAEKMVIRLTTGQQISLKKAAPGLTVLLFSLGWDIVQGSGLKKLLKSDFDLDSAVLCLDAESKLKKSTDVIYYGHPNHASGAITHLGDNTTGEGEGDNEQILVNLSQVPAEIGRLVFVVNIYECIPRHQTFGDVSNAFVRLVDMEKGTEIARYNLSGEKYSEQTGMIFAEVYRQDIEWYVAAVGEGIKVRSLQELVSRRYI
ncbi:MAG: chloride channel protein [Xenococcaceae cyanobacterium]